jgi:DnaJ-like protein
LPFGDWPILPLFLALLVLGVILYLIGWLPKADAGLLARWIKKSSGVIFVAGAAFILTRNIGIAIFAGMLAYSALSKLGWFSGLQRPSARAGATSTVRTASLEMALNHATGEMSGRVLKGRYQGRELSGLKDGELMDLLSELSASDEKSAHLLEAYLDRMSPGWGGRRAYGNSKRNRASHGMGLEEAYLVLGLGPNATREEVQTAHRNLMKRNHPDQGGSTYIASKVNEAKDVLMRHIKV